MVTFKKMSKKLNNKKVLSKFILILFVGISMISGFAAEQPSGKEVVPFEPTHPKVVAAMLKLGNAGPGDIHYDLGCGDGRIVIAGVKNFKTEHGYGIDINRQRLKEAGERAEYTGVTEKVTFSNQNIFNSDFSKATLITAYLLDHINLKMRPILFSQLRPGTRVVTHEFHMDDWRPDQVEYHPLARGKRITLWVMPAPIGGQWEWSTTYRNRTVGSTMRLTQRFQDYSGSHTFDDGPSAEIGNQEINGGFVSFTVRSIVNGRRVAVKYSGFARGDTIRGVQVWNSPGHSGIYSWIARRRPVNATGTWTIDIPQKEKFNGILNIRKEASRLKATFFSADGSSRKNIDDVYLWGSSVYFRMPISRSKFILFRGELNNDNGNGQAVAMEDRGEYKEGIYNPPSEVWTVNWTARRNK